MLFLPKSSTPYLAFVLFVPLVLVACASRPKPIVNRYFSSRSVERLTPFPLPSDSSSVSFRISPVQHFNDTLFARSSPSFYIENIKLSASPNVNSCFSIDSANTFHFSFIRPPDTIFVPARSVCSVDTVFITAPAQTKRNFSTSFRSMFLTFSILILIFLIIIYQIKH